MRAVAVMLLCLAAPAAGAPGATAKVPAGWLGVAVGEDLPRRPALIDDEFRRMAASGARTARVTVDWNVAQPFAGWTPWLAPTDALVLAAARHGVTILPTVVGAPAWASDDRSDGTYVLTPRDPAQYADWLRVLVARYGPAGTLWGEHPGVRARPMRAWQIWNEPNLNRYWRGDWEAGYLRLLQTAYPAIKAADPGGTVVLAGLPNYSWLALGSLYRRGARPFFDAVAIHPYTRGMSGLLQLVEANRRVMRAHGDARKALWITELGWPAAKGRAVDLGFSVSSREQARLVERAIGRLAADRTRQRIAHVLWYSWLSRATGTSDPFAYSGLRWLTPQGGVRSTGALRAYARVARRIGARPAR